ncbi:chemotaxis protein CheD [Dawidia soli]|uniref:Probable chemoreceptor glutamine deamidase CheD n=1 Tax=Dawidia soli TaxID=2782352 RepID=A0AAP2DHL9_9BACT|nr:chemotaxis protein CheD [Dawidia soli]MBT1689532.1 chemotaxis protein CheD [Dawidia soli]
MKRVILNIGDAHAVEGAATFTCFGLGSCIGLFLQDRTLDLSGGAHIMLPEDTTSSHACAGKYYNVRGAIDHLLKQFARKGSSLKSIRAKITGGANVIQSMYNVGSLNAESTLHHLTRRGVYIAATDVGGFESRTVNFNTHTGGLNITNPGRPGERTI